MRAAVIAWDRAARVAPAPPPPKSPADVRRWGRVRLARDPGGARGKDPIALRHELLDDA